MEGELLSVIVEFQIGEGDVADYRIKFGQNAVAEILDTDILAGMPCFGDSPGDAVKFYPDEPHPFRSLGDEVPRTATGLQDQGIIRNAEAGNRIVHGRDDGG